MLLLMPVFHDRLSPLLDVARQFLLIELVQEQEQRRRALQIDEPDPVLRARRIVEQEVEVVICGAVSWPFESILAAAGVQVIPNICGTPDEVLAAFLKGRLREAAFRLPGCVPGVRRRRRRRGA